MNRTRLKAVLTIVGIFFSLATFAAEYLTSKDIKALTATPAEYRLPYGKEALQFGDLRLPKGKGPYPVVVVIHGGCWLSKFVGASITAPLAEKLTQKGYATWNIDYRGVDTAGGGWPGTFQDVGNAIDYLRKIAPKYHLDLKHVVIIGHSAGGHLALWAAARHKLPSASVINSKNSLRIRGVIDLGGPGSLQAFIPMEEEVCGDNQIFARLLGTNPEVIKKRLAQVSPDELLPFGVKQILITGDNDVAVPPQLGEDYVEMARNKGDEATFILVKNAGHFEVIAPDSMAWPLVEAAVHSLME